MSKVKLDMTGDEFKRLVEQLNPNGQVDTIPEMLAAFADMQENETIEGYMRRKGLALTEDIAQRILAFEPMSEEELLDILEDESIPED